MEELDLRIAQPCHFAGDGTFFPSYELFRLPSNFVKMRQNIKSLTLSMIDEVPTWLGNLSELTSLTISNMKTI